MTHDEIREWETTWSNWHDYDCVWGGLQYLLTLPPEERLRILTDRIGPLLVDDVDEPTRQSVLQNGWNDT